MDIFHKLCRLLYSERIVKVEKSFRQFSADCILPSNCANAYDYEFEKVQIGFPYLGSCVDSGNDSSSDIEKRILYAC